MLDLARESELTIYFQSPKTAELAVIRAAADEAGLLGQRVVVKKGTGRKCTWPASQ